MLQCPIDKNDEIDLVEFMVVCQTQDKKIFGFQFYDLDVAETLAREIKKAIEALKVSSIEQLEADSGKFFWFTNCC